MVPIIITALATGDALGKPFENCKRDDVEMRAWFHDPNNTFLACSSVHRGHDFDLGPAGEVAGASTDDTQMAVALGRSLLECGEYDPANAWLHYRSWFRGEGFGGRARGVGGTIRKALETDAPVDLRAGGVYVGNGGAMRVAPIGVYYRNDLVALLKAARADARLTHDSPEAEAGSVAVAVAIASSIKHGGVENACHLVWKDVLAALRSEELRHTATFAKIAHARTASVFGTTAHGAGIGTMGVVADTVASALLTGNSADDFEECVCNAIEHAGDTDTRAAIAAAIRMARGDCAIPERWHGVELREELLELDARLWKAGGS